MRPRDKAAASATRTQGLWRCRRAARLTIRLVGIVVVHRAIALIRNPIGHVSVPDLEQLAAFSRLARWIDDAMLTAAQAAYPRIEWSASSPVGRPCAGGPRLGAVR